MSKIRNINPEKMQEFLYNFYKNPKEWYKKQIEEDFEFDEETQLKIIEEKFYVKNDYYAIKYIKNPTKRVCLEAVKKDWWVIKYIENPTEEMCLEAIKQDGGAIQYIKKQDQNFDIVKTFFDSDFSNCLSKQKDYYKYLYKKFITKEQGLIMIEDNPENINLLSGKIQKEILEMKPELGKYVYKDLDDFFE